MQNTAYKGTDFILFLKPKFLLEMRIAYSDLYFSIKTPKLFARLRLPFFTSMGTTFPSVFLLKRKLSKNLFLQSLVSWMVGNDFFSEKFTVDMGIQFGCCYLFVSEH